MKYTAFLVLILLGSVSLADSFDCGLYYNLDRISDNVVETKIGVKALITKTDEATAYLNQKKENEFEIEVFLPEHQMRVYSQAELSLGKAQISITNWSRESLIDVICKRLE